MPSARDTLFDDASGDIALGELFEAEVKLRQCVELDSNFFEGWHALAMVLYKQEKLEEALAAGLRATQLSPNDALGWTSLSQIFVQLGKISEAEDAKSKARVISWGGKIDRAAAFQEPPSD